MKKGDLSINLIIVAAIALLILVILAVLLFRTGGNINQGTNCEGLGGACVDEGTSCTDYTAGWVDHPTAGCSVQGQHCCVKL